MFDDSIDLVVWGHEHDCRISPEIVAGKKYAITQPGSSVATSLADGESVEKCVSQISYPHCTPADQLVRHVALLEIQGKDYQMTPIPLRTVRPFVIEQVVLTEAAEEEGFDVSDQIAVTKFLKSRVSQLSTTFLTMFVTCRR